MGFVFITEPLNNVIPETLRDKNSISTYEENSVFLFSRSILPDIVWPAPSLDIVRLAELREVLGEATGTLRQVAGLDRGRGGMRLAELDHAIDGLLCAAAAMDGWKAAREAMPEDVP